jgi:sulfide dehydrogenase [flavocytochrome c] flavoprotein subunit
MDHKINRRKFLQTSAALAAASVAVPGSQAGESGKAVEAPAIGLHFSSPAPLPKKKGPRIVIVGAGWSGLTMAKYLKKNAPGFDVVLLDKREQFVSCPISNAWIANQVNLEFLTHSYVDAAKNNDYLFISATAIDLDRAGKTLYTTEGAIAYDYLVMAPGIDYDYARIGADDPEVEQQLRMHYPAGFNSASEVMAIKHKIENFDGGTLLMTVPTGNYRCMAAPYERACMAAAVMKQRRVKGKILLLDGNNGIRIKADGFRRAFSEYYADIIEYESSAAITGIDLENREIETEFDNYQFDDAVIYPPIRASRVLENFGLADPASPQKEAAIEPYKYHLLDDEHVYVTGDSRSQPFSKSGNTAHSEAKYVAEVIIAHAKGEEIAWRSPQTMCFSGVKTDPLESMSIIAFYKFDEFEKSFAFDRVHLMEKWSPRSGQAGLAWAEGMFRDMFYS